MRETYIEPTAGASATVSISLIRDERRRIIVTGMETSSLILTIASDPAAAPLIEIPGSAGQFDLHPAAIQILSEGGVYDYNIWTRDAADDLVQIASGKLSIGPSIAPAGVDQATAVFADGTSIVTLTQSAYAALAAKAPTTLYVVTEDPA